MAHACESKCSDFDSNVCAISGERVSDELKAKAKPAAALQHAEEKEEKALLVAGAVEGGGGDDEEQGVSKQAPAKKKKAVQLKSVENIHLLEGKEDDNTLSTSSSSRSSKSRSSTSSSSSSGGKFSYVVLVASFVAYMLATVLSSCFGIFFENMETDLGWSKSKVALIGGIISALPDLSGPIAR